VANDPLVSEWKSNECVGRCDQAAVAGRLLTTARRREDFIMGRTRPPPHRPRPQADKPRGEQQLSHTAWAQIVKAIRALSPPRAA